MNFQFKNNFKWLLVASGVLTSILFIILTITGAITEPIHSTLLSKCVGRRLFGSCITYADFYKLFLVALYSFLSILIVKIPVLYLFGFKSKRKILLAISAVALSTLFFHFARFVFDGVNSLLALPLTIIFESWFLIFRLKTELRRETIILAVSVASLALFLLRSIWGEFPFFSLPFISY